MKKSNKYNLLSKDEPLKEKDQQEWVELQPKADWKQKKSENHDTSYMKLDDQISYIEGDTLHLNGSNHKSSFSVSSNQKPQQQNQQNYQNVQKSSITNPQTQKIPPQQQQRVSTSAVQQHSQLNQQDQGNRQKAQMPIQAPQNPYNSQYNVGPAYVQRSFLPTSFVNNHLVPTFGPKAANYSMINMPVMYSQYQPQSYMYQGNYQSQYQPNNYQQPVNLSQYRQNPMNSRVPQTNQNQTSPNNSSISRSTLNTVTRSSYRPSIPQMTVNCGKCTFTQSVPGNAQMFICCMCNQIDECFPLYGIFTCGICKAKVIYPHGTSELIKCTKCQTVNRVSSEPKKRDEDISVGKECAEEQEPILKGDDNDYEDSDGKMRRNQPQLNYHEQKPQPKIMLKNPDQPFKVLPAKKIEEKQQQSQESNLYPDIQLPKDQTRFNVDKNKDFSEELIELDSRSKENETGNENLHKEVFELSEKLDESLVLGKEEQKVQMKIEIPHLNQASSPLKIATNPNLTYPSIFDD